jgi:7-cyano-7-deazaguanine synthase in queuosine biosynthesis
MEGILVLLSGGIESTYCLQEALKTELPVHVHHINMINHQMRHIEEKKACYFIMEYFKQKGYSFSYSETTVDFSMCPESVPFDDDITIFIAAKVAEGIPFDVLTVYEGSNKNDFKKESVINRFKMRGDDYEFFHNCHYNVGERVQHVNLEYPCKDLTKEDVWYLLNDEELRGMTWSCRAPYLCEPCGKCEPCIERSNFVKTSISTEAN